MTGGDKGRAMQIQGVSVQKGGEGREEKGAKVKVRREGTECVERERKVKS